MKKILIITSIVLIATSAYAEPDWTRGRGWNTNALKKLTQECVATKIVDVQTEAGAKMLEDICFEDVLAGRWNKKSKKKYLKSRQTTININYKGKK